MFPFADMIYYEIDGFFFSSILKPVHELLGQNPKFKGYRKLV